MAGLPKGRTNNPGGRPKGAKNKATAAKEKAIAESGLTPLDFMLNVLRDGKKSFEERMEAAKAAAPYVHPRLSSVDAKVKADVSLNDYSDDELDAIIAQSAAEAGISLGGEGEG